MNRAWRPTWRPSRRPEGGVTVVEAAFALPLLFLFFFGLIDLGMWTFNSNQAANAARDGARAGILAYPLQGVDALDLEDAAARAQIVAAVRANLPDGTVDDAGIDIECLDAAGSTIACTGGDDPDRIRVTVEWNWTLVTPVAAVVGVTDGAARGSATMAVVGRPLDENAPGSVEPVPEEPVPEEPDAEDPDPQDPAPDAPEPCSASALTASPSPIGSQGNQLTEPLAIAFTTNGSAACDDLWILLRPDRYDSGAATIEHVCGCVEDDDDATSFSWSYTGSDNKWKKGEALVVLMNGTTELRQTSFSVVGK